MPQTGDVAIFWDFESLPASLELAGHETVENVRSLAQPFGNIVLFKAYLEVSLTPSSLRSQLQSSGVSLTDCPRRINDSVVDKMLTTDMMTFAMDHKPPATIILISIEEAYAYPLSILRFRNYQVVVISPSDVNSSLTVQASVHLAWNPRAANELSIPEPPNASNHHAAASSRRSVTSSTNRVITPSARASLHNDDGDEEDDPIYGPCPSAYKSSRRNVLHANGITEGHIPSTPPNDMTWNWQTPSRATSKPSPPLSFRSARSPPPTPPPPMRTIVTNGETLFESSIHPNLPQGFPFREAEPVSTPTAPPLTPIPGKMSISEPAAVATVQSPTKPTSPPPRTPTPPKDVPGIFGLVTPSQPLSQPATAPVSLPPAHQQVVKDKPVPTRPNFSPTITPAPVAHKPSSAKPVTSSAAQPLKANHSITPQASGSRPPAIPSYFTPLVSVLKDRSGYKGQQIPRTDVGSDMSKNKKAYTQAGVSSFASFILMAREAGIVDVGGSGNEQWIKLRSQWYGT